MALPAIPPSPRVYPALTFINIALRTARAGYALSPSTPLSLSDSTICHGLLGQSWNDWTSGTALNSSLTDRLCSSPKNRSECRAPEGENRACGLLLNISAVWLDSICQETSSYGMRWAFLWRWMYSKTSELLIRTLVSHHEVLIVQLRFKMKTELKYSYLCRARALTDVSLWL